MERGSWMGTCYAIQTGLSPGSRAKWEVKAQAQVILHGLGEKRKKVDQEAVYVKQEIASPLISGLGRRRRKLKICNSTLT